MPYFNTSLKDNRFIVESVVLDIRSLGSEKTSAYIQESNFEGDGRSAAKALIDTGATHCSITEELAQKLNLIPTGTETIGTAGHPIECKQYLILLGIPVSEVQGYQKILNKETNQEQMVPMGINHFKPHLTRVSGIPTQQKERGFDVIIGMDLLGKMIFHYTGNPATPAGNLTIGF